MGLTDCVRNRINATVIGSKQAAKEVKVGAEDDGAASDIDDAEKENAPSAQSTE